MKLFTYEVLYLWYNWNISNSYYVNLANLFIFLSERILFKYKYNAFLIKLIHSLNFNIFDYLHGDYILTF